MRHAKAGSRERWAGPDTLRPLTRSGRRQAEAIALLIDGPLERLVSSPYVRCLQTLEPLATAHGLAVETADELGEGARAGLALELALSLVDDGSAVVLCTHGDVTTLVVDELLAGGVPLEGPRETKKGGRWILDVRNARVESGRYIAPPPKSALR